MMELRLIAAFECTCCRQFMPQEDVPEAAIVAVIFGQRDSYQICPKCLQRVSEEDARDRNYRRRCRAYLKSKSKNQNQNQGTKP